MCNQTTNEHYWIIGGNTSNVQYPIVGAPCMCGSVKWQAAQQGVQPTVLTPCACGGERQLLTRCQRCRTIESHSG